MVTTTAPRVSRPECRAGGVDASKRELRSRFGGLMARRIAAPVSEESEVAARWSRLLVEMHSRSHSRVEESESCEGLTDADGGVGAAERAAVARGWCRSETEPVYRCRAAALAAAGRPHVCPIDTSKEAERFFGRKEAVVNLRAFKNHPIKEPH